jgi:nitrogen fixation-related uncharacterized protein
VKKLLEELLVFLIPVAILLFVLGLRACGA